MEPERSCLKCAAPLGRIAGEMLCPGCLLETGLAEPEPVGPTERRFGDYELLDEIARGGMGVVYRARQIGLDRFVAVKLLLSGSLATPEVVQRFRAEASAAASLQHPNIVAIHEVGFCDGQHFIAMDYVAGRSLADLVREGPLDARRAASYVKTVAEAIHFAHEHKILHRDLKPSNVLVDQFDAPHVTDFGLARRLDAETVLTLSGHVLGSPGYMAPEQAASRGGQIGRHTDVYSLGALLFHLLTGRAPFMAGTIPATLHAVMHTEAVSPRVLVPELPRDLETICLKCLEKEPSRRYATAQQLADELACFLRGEPIKARPVTSMERAWRWAKRKPALATLIVLVHLVGAVGFSGIVWQWLRAERNATEAAMQRDIAEGRLYAAEMRLAHAEYQEGMLGSVRERLEAWDSSRRPGRPDWRGFEWRWLQRLSASTSSEVLATNASGFSAVAVSTDGRTLALGAGDGTVELVEARTGARQKSWVAHPGAIDSVEFVPNRNWLVTIGGDDGQLKIWDAEQARLLGSAPCLKGVLARVAVSPDGRLLAASAAEEYSINLWDITGAPEDANFPRFDRSVVGLGPAVFSPDGRTLAIANRDMGFHPDLYDLESVEVEVEVEPLQPPQHNFMHSIAFSPDGQWLATGSSDGTVALWDVSRRARAHLFQGNLSIHALTFSADSQTLFAATADRHIHRWALAAPERALILRGHSDRPQALAVLRDEAALVSASIDGTVRRWRTDSEALARASGMPAEFEIFKEAGLPNRGVALALSVDQRSLAVTFLRQIYIFDLASGGRRAVIESANAFGLGFLVGTRFLAFSPDGAYLALGGAGGWLTLLDATTLQPVREPLRVSEDHNTHVAFALGGQVIVSGHARFGGVTVTEIKEWRTNWQHSAAGNFFTEPVAVSPDGTLLASASPGGHLTIREVKSGRQVAVCPQPVRFLRAVTFSPDGRTIAFSDESAAIFLWDWAGRRPLRRLAGHRDGVLSLAFSPDGRTLASGSIDQTIRLWHPDLDQELAVLTGHTSIVYGVAFDASGQTLASVAHDGTVLVWRAAPATGAAR
jgi:eukaryotic-like serine/threonine-protein kinase